MRAGLPTLAITIGTLCLQIKSSSESIRSLVGWTIKLAAYGAEPAGCCANPSSISWNQRSNSSSVRGYAVGNEPIKPCRPAATTNRGPETRNIGATTIGSRSPETISFQRPAPGILSGSNHNGLRVQLSDLWFAVAELRQDLPAMLAYAGSIATRAGPGA